MSISSHIFPEPFRFARYDETLERDLMRAPRDQIRKYQSERLLHLVKYAYQKIPFYRELWDAAGFRPEGVQSIDDLPSIPTWNVNNQRASIEKNPPFGSYCTEDVRNDVAFMLSTSGTTGTPRLAMVGNSDLPGMMDIMSRAYRWIGLGPGDLIQITFTYAPLGAAWCCARAAQAAGVGVLASSSGRTTSSDRQIELMRLAGVTALIGTASYLLHLAEEARRMGYDPAMFKVRKVITAGELSSAATRKSLEEIWNARVYDLFGSVDTLTWSSLDCDASRAEHGALGMHIWEDACVIEVLDDNGKPVPPGEYGEMCVTSWVWRSSPKIRFRTGDLIAVQTDLCKCGRTLARMMPVAGRVDHVLRMRATHIYPMALESAILAAVKKPVEWLAEAVNGDRLSVKIESERPDNEDTRVSLENDLRKRLALNSVDVALVGTGSTAEITGAGRDPKVRRVFDRRAR